MKIKLIDKYGFSKVIDVEQRVKTIRLATVVYGFIDFELFDIPKRGLPVFKQISDL